MEQDVKIAGRQLVAGKITGTIFMLLIVGIPLAIILHFVLPYLIDIAWDSLQAIWLFAAVAISVFFVAAIVSFMRNKKVRMALRLAGAKFATKTLDWAITLDPWNVLNEQVDEAEEDRKQLGVETERLQGQYEKLQIDLDQNQKEMKDAYYQKTEVEKLLRKNPNDEEVQNQLAEVTNTFSQAKDFIDGVQPIANDIMKLVTFAQKAYDKSETTIKIMRQTIKKQRAMFDAVTAGSAALGRAQKAFNGDPLLNEAAAIALDKLRTDVGMKIGKIKTEIKIVSKAMNQQDLRDAAKVAQAVDTMKQLADDPNLQYSPAQISAMNSDVATFNSPQAGNKYLSGYLNDKK